MRIAHLLRGLIQETQRELERLTSHLDEIEAEAPMSTFGPTSDVVAAKIDVTREFLGKLRDLEAEL